MELVKLSPTALCKFLECPACFWREYHKQMPPSLPLPGVLSKLDALQKEYYDGYRNKLPPLLKGFVDGVLVPMDMALRFRKRVSYEDKKLKAVLAGKMDDCFISGKKLIVMDNKTGNPDNAELMELYKLQLEAYAFILSKEFEVSDFGYLIYYQASSGNPEEGIKFKTTVKRVNINYSRISTIFREAVECARLTKPPQRHKDCAMCEWIREIETD